MRDLLWDIAKSCDDDLENTELNALEEPEELFVAKA